VARTPSHTLARILAVLLVVGLVVAIGFVATTRGFPSTHRAVTGFFHEGLGLSERATTQATNIVRKAFHVPAYALVAILAWWALPRRVRHPWVVLGLVALIGLMDEWIQSRNPARSGSLWDVLIDLVGASLGLWLVMRRRREGARRAEGSPSGP
jgi:VanZ family protein